MKKLLPLIVLSVFLLSLFYAEEVNAAGCLSNGDFESGNTGFSSDYTYAPGSSLLPEGAYAVVNDPKSVHPFATSFGDRTTGSGLMLVANGAASPGLAVWSQSVSVNPSTDYTFTGWVASWTSAALATLEIRVNGTTVGTVTAPSTSGIWEQFTVSWNSGVSNSADIEIVDTNLALDGNDFALDDLSFPCPSLVPCGGTGQPACNLCHIFVLIKNILDVFLFPIVPIIAALLIAIGGFMLFAAAGNPANLGKAKTIFFATIIGLFIIYGSFVFISMLLTSLGVLSWTGLGTWWQITC